MTVPFYIYPGSPALVRKAVDVVERYTIWREIRSGQEEIDTVAGI
jgi:hypothetical protein